MALSRRNISHGADHSCERRPAGVGDGSCAEMRQQVKCDPKDQLLEIKQQAQPPTGRTKGIQL